MTAAPSGVFVPRRRMTGATSVWRLGKRQGVESMKPSTDRILTTHMGSLPRPDVLADLLVAGGAYPREHPAEGSRVGACGPEGSEPQFQQALFP
jgi:hypothetical protein